MVSSSSFLFAISVEKVAGAVSRRGRRSYQDVPGARFQFEFEFELETMSPYIWEKEGYVRTSPAKNPVKVQRPVIRLLPPLFSLFRRLDCQQPLPASLSLSLLASPYFPDVWNGFRQLLRIFQQNVLSMLGSAAQS